MGIMTATCEKEAVGLETFDEPIKDVPHATHVFRELRGLPLKGLKALFRRHCSGEPTTDDRKLLQAAVAYTLILKGDIYRDGEPVKTKAERLRALELCQRDVVAVRKEQEKESKVSEETKTVEKTTEKKEAKATAPKGDAISEKLKGMTFEQIADYAKSLGVEGVNAQLKRPKGLASMWLRNQIRAASKKKE
ncbi:MAG: hypothetical protein Q8K86_11530 [Candidatus Nanopelagicaceae bacterium]|nr:hypothetical protein [Candidatus Nanopelagicaceae bacterium]